jgi:twitching motility protein PilT
MKSVEKLLRALERPEVEELALVSGRLPCARVGTSFDPLDEEALTADTILAMLVAAGGSRYVDALGPTPKQWAVRVPGVGNVNVSAAQRGAMVLARFSLTSRPQKAAEPSDAGVLTPRRSVRPSLAARSRTSEAPRSSRSSRNSLRATKSSSKHSSRPKAADDSKGRSVPPDPARGGRSESKDSAEEAFRRKPTAPAVPRIRAADGVAAREPADLVLDTPSIVGGFAPQPLPGPGGARGDSGPARPHVHVKGESSREGTPWQPEADTQPALSAVLDAEFSALLEQARAAKASDLHIVAGRPPLFRVAGELKPRGNAIAVEAVQRMVLPLVPRRLANVLETLGSCDFALESPKHGRFRVNVGRQHSGIKACLRLVPRDLPTLGGLGLPAELTRASGHHQGLVLFTGPTGHGKTTTLTAVVDQINETTTHHIITVEDPVENVHVKKKALISQREVGTHTATFASALRAALREDPDVIVVGELRDVETVRMAVAASETGHLVLGTMNTPSAAKTIDRLIDLFPPPDQPQVRLTLASGLRLIVGQRLVPSPDRTRVHAAIELLPGSVPLSAIIRDNKTFQIPSLQQRGKGFGIIRLDESLADLIRSGRALLEDALTIAEAPAELEAAFKGRPTGIAPGAHAPNLSGSR